MALLVVIGMSRRCSQPSRQNHHDAPNAETSQRKAAAPPHDRPLSAPSSSSCRARIAWAALAFVVLFKFTDAFSGVMTGPFVIDLGFSRNDYASIVKGVGLAATLIGGFAGGFVARAYSAGAKPVDRRHSAGLANLSFSWLAIVGVNEWALAVAITAENFTSAIGTVMFVAYLSALCRNPLHTATQYALLTALAAVGRTYLSATAGDVAKATGWPAFFAICMLVAVPGLVLLLWLQRRGHFAELEAADAQKR